MNRQYISNTGSHVTEKTFIKLINKGLIPKSNYEKQFYKIYNGRLVFNPYTERLNTIGNYNKYLKNITAYQNTLIYDVYKVFTPKNKTSPIVKWYGGESRQLVYLTKKEQILKKSVNLLEDINNEDGKRDEMQALWHTYINKHDLKSKNYDEIFLDNFISDYDNNGDAIANPILKKYISSYPGILHNIIEISGLYIYSIVSIESKKILTKSLSEKELKNMILFNSYVNIDIKNFINDTSELIGEINTNQCVIDCLIYHLKLNKQNIKLTREKIIDILNINNNDPQQGFNCLQIANLLDKYSCNYKFLDYHQKEFLSNNTNNKNKKLPYFIGIVYGNHLYYCNDKEYIKKFSLNSNMVASSNKNIKITEFDEENDFVFEKDDLTNKFIEMFEEDNTVRKIKTYNNKIIQINIPEDDKNYYANKDHVKIREICNLSEICFNNQNMTSICKYLFDNFFVNHKKSQFFENVTQYFKTNSNIIKIFDITQKYEEENKKMITEPKIKYKETSFYLPKNIIIDNLKLKNINTLNDFLYTQKENIDLYFNFCGEELKINIKYDYHDAKTCKDLNTYLIKYPSYIKMYSKQYIKPPQQIKKKLYTQLQLHLNNDSDDDSDDSDDELVNRIAAIENKKNTQESIDINKCRTACFYDNKLGPYPVFDIYNDIEEYQEGDLSLCGWFYVINFDHKYLNNNYWYSGEFLKILKNEFNYNFEIKYKFIASNKLPHDYGKKYIEYIIDNFKPYYKDIINKTIGYFGKTKQTHSKGYIEFDYDIAVSNYLQTNIFYSLKDTKTHNNRLRSKNKYNNGEFQEINISTIKTKKRDLYMVEKKTNKRIYDNDLPIYQKILENEWLRVLQLQKKMGGKLIAIKTDNIITEGGTTNFDFKGINYSDEDLGGYKNAHKINISVPPIINKKNIDELTINTQYNWNQITADENTDHLNNFEQLIKKINLNRNFCINAKAGYGKSHLAKHLPYFNNDTTLILAFTNIAALNLAGKTINSTFSVDFNSNDACPNKIKLMKNINHIIIDEFSMIPPYIMKILYKIYKSYPHIRWVFMGDPHQNRPVKFDNLDWFKTNIFIEMCHHNVIILTKNIRNDLTKYYDDLIEGKEININNFGSHTQSKINIVKTNKKRMEINKYYMNMNMDMNKNGVFIKNLKQIDKKDINTKDNETVDNKYLSYHDKQQDVYLLINTPVMSIVNKKKSKKDIDENEKDKKYVNGERFKIINLNKNDSNNYDIEISNDTNILTVSESEFMSNFVVSYAMTNHKCQGITINEPYIIHQWGFMTSREKYTAFSRATQGKYISIINKNNNNYDNDLDDDFDNDFDDDDDDINGRIIE